MDRRLCEEYVRWLAQIYSRQADLPPLTDDDIHQASRIIDRHRRRIGGRDDFISLVAIRVSEMLAREQKPLASFHAVVETAADTVRHRITRHAKKHSASQLEMWPAMEPAAKPNQIMADRISDLLSTLGPKEQLVLKAIIDGESYLDVARQLRVSVRTIYRLLDQIRGAIRLRDSAE